jgi:hypothetical protein
VRQVIIATILLLGMVVPVPADDQSRVRSAGDTSDGRVVCIIEVLHSEELPGAPIFQNLVRATLRITLPDSPPFETTVESFIPWQVPPPRQGQRLKLLCDPARLGSLAFY